MSQTEDAVVHSNQKPTLEFKSSSFTVPALLLNSTDLTDIVDKLQQTLQQAPEFFKNSPVLLDVTALNAQGIAVDVANLVKLVRSNALIPVALRGGTPAQNQMALKIGISVRPSAPNEQDKPLAAVPVGPSPIAPAGVEAVNVADGERAPAETMIVSNPIRSGQRVYAAGDLVVLATVSAGAEIMAEGHIHVYGSLRGRALAGVQGNINSRIFCSDLQAELISIAGHYKMSEHLNKSTQHKPLQIYLQDHALIIKEL